MFYIRIFCTYVFFLVTFWLWCQNFVQKMRAKNIDEIDNRCRFHQRFTYKFFLRMLFRQLRIWHWMNFCTKNSGKKHWWNWRQVSILATFFVHIFLYESAFLAPKCYTKAVCTKILCKNRGCKMLMKLTPGNKKDWCWSIVKKCWKTYLYF